MSLTACAGNTTETVRTISDYCLIAKGISFSEPHGTDVETAANKYDTPETIKQVKAHDLSYEAVCKSEATPQP